MLGFRQENHAILFTLFWKNLSCCCVWNVFKRRVAQPSNDGILCQIKQIWIQIMKDFIQEYYTLTVVSQIILWSQTEKRFNFIGQSKQKPRENYAWRSRMGCVWVSGMKGWRQCNYTFYLMSEYFLERIIGGIIC